MGTSTISGTCSQRFRNCSNHSLILDRLLASLASEQKPESVLHRRFSLLGGKLQDLKIAAVATTWHRRLQQVVRHAEAAAREQVLAIAIAGEGARLAHQPVDDVPVLLHFSASGAPFEIGFPPVRQTIVFATFAARFWLVSLLGSVQGDR